MLSSSKGNEFTRKDKTRQDKKRKERERKRKRRGKKGKGKGKGFSACSAARAQVLSLCGLDFCCCAPVCMPLRT
jgi:hypothetical protein